MIKLSGQKVNDGIVANLVLFSGLRSVAFNSCSLVFDEELLELTSDFTRSGNGIEMFRINAFDYGKLFFTQRTENSKCRDFCYITKDNIFHGKSVSQSKEINFYTLFNENGFLNEKEYDQNLSEDFGLIKAKSETKYDIDNNEFIETNIVTMDGEVIGRKAKSNDFSELTDFVCINIPNFSMSDASNSFDMVFPELSGIAIKYHKNIKSSVK